MDAALFIVFLSRLIRGLTRKIYLIVDRLQAHQAEVVQHWLAEHKGRIEVVSAPDGGDFTAWLDRRTVLRLPLLLLASGRHTATSWFRAAGITDEFRPAYHTIYAVGRRANQLAITAWLTARPCLTTSRRLLLAIDDTPTPRYGPCVEGAGIHHNPTPGPAGEKFIYGQQDPEVGLWWMPAGLAQHPDWGTLSLLLHASLYVRQ
jgi:hypothetical protein